MACTRKDVAKLAGVGASTVSYVLSGKKKFSTEVEERVWKAIAKLGYYPDYNARVMHQSKGENICYVTEVVAGHAYNEIISGIESVAVTNNNWLSVKLMSFNKWEKNIPDFLSRKIDGIIFAIDPTTIDESILQRLLDNGVKLLFLIPKFETKLSISQLCPDYEDGMNQIVSHLKEYGHTKIAYLNIFPEGFPYDTRFIGFTRAIKRNNAESEVFQCDYKSENEKEITIKAVRHIVKNTKATAIVCPNEGMAFIAVMELKRLGYKVPEDFSVTSIDETVLGEMCDPQLTTLSFDYREHGKRAAELLYDYIDNNKYIVEMYKLHLIKKGSVGTAKQR